MTMLQSACLSVAICLAIALSNGTGNSLAADKPFTHPGFVNAAEIIRHTQAGWSDNDQRLFEHLLRNVFYPIIKDFYPAANGNWDAAMIQTMLAIGVFLDDREMFQRAVDYYLNGQENGAIRHYINDFGECQESGRDQAHTQRGLGYPGCAAEIAWKQCVDLYGAYGNRLALGFEYTAKYNLGHDVPYEPYRSHAGTDNYPAILRPWGTLMHAGLPVFEKRRPGNR